MTIKTPHIHVPGYFRFNPWVEARDYLMIALGTFVYCVGQVCFMLPYGLTAGGVSGISAIVYYATGLEVQVTYSAINAVFLIAAIIVLGWKFCIKTIWGVSTTTFWLWIFQRILMDDSGQLPQLIGNEAFMACVLGALIQGTGLFFCFSNNGSTGGTDIIAAIVNKYKNVSLGQILMICDIIIISSCYFIFHDWYRVIFGFVMLIVSNMTLDYHTSRSRQSVQFMIFSRNPSAIANAIIKKGHGVTMLSGEGWYTNSERKVIVSIVKQRDQVNIFRMIRSIDPYAFVSMGNVKGVWGEGFDKMKVTKDKSLQGKRTLVFASNSEHKLAEVRAILGPKYDIRSLADIGCYIDIPEKAATIQGNALLKANFVKRYYGFDCFADDTALECTALGGLPGVYSSRYAAVDVEKEAGSNAKTIQSEEYTEELSKKMLDILHNHAPVVEKPDNHNVAANVNKLLNEMANAKDRSAHLHTAVALVTGESSDPKECETQIFDGILEGTIATEPYGNPNESFFYDSVFIPVGQQMTYAELGADVKNNISQRFIAINKMKRHIEKTK